MAANSLVPIHLTRRCALCGLWLATAFPLTLLVIAFLSILFRVETGVHISPWIVAPSLLLAHGTAGALWGRGMARITGRSDPLRWMAAGGMGFGVTSALAVEMLNRVEQNLVWFLVRSYKVHLVFGVAFTLAALAIAGGTGLLVGLALARWRLAVQLALGAGLAAAMTFALVALGMDLVGMRVGAPGAEDRATMIVVSLLGMWSAGVVGSVVIGQTVVRGRDRPVPRPLLDGSAA